jgi:excisionase family DNA binding protein
MNTHQSSSDQVGGSPTHLDYSTCATVSLAEAARVLGVHRSTAWELHKRGEFPLPVLKVGSRLRVAKVHLQAYVLGPSAGSGAAS